MLVLFAIFVAFYLTIVYRSTSGDFSCLLTGFNIVLIYHCYVIFKLVNTWRVSLSSGIFVGVFTNRHHFRSKRVISTVNGTIIDNMVSNFRTRVRNLPALQIENALNDAINNLVSSTDLILWHRKRLSRLSIVITSKDIIEITSNFTQIPG